MPYRVELSGYQDIDGVLWGGWRWDSPGLTYSFPTSTSQYDQYGQIDGFQAFNAAMQSAAIRSLTMYAAVSGLYFDKAADAGKGNLRFAQATSFDANDGYGKHAPGYETAEATPPDTVFPGHTQGDSWYMSGVYTNPIRGSYEFMTIMHEVGHALGLKHGHDINYDASTGPGSNPIKLSADHDSLEYSIMTYRSYPRQVADADGFFESPTDYPSTLMQADILALQWLYGADYNYNSGNNVYRWSASTGEMFVDGQGFNGTNNRFGGQHVNKKIFMTVWDGGGVDTYDFSNFSTKVVCNLKPGSWSTPDTQKLAELGDGVFARGSIANAQVFSGDLRGYIENAIGGSNHDTINGNWVANTIDGRDGNDFIRGWGNNDKLYGGNGNDLLSGNDANDLLWGGAGNDSLWGGTGNDYLRGMDGADKITGNSGSDNFDYNAVSESSAAARDLIADFDYGNDWFDFASIDANSATAANDAFSFIGAAAFSAAGQVRAYQSGANVIVEANTSGASGAELAIVLANVSLSIVTAGDFVL